MRPQLFHVAFVGALGLVAGACSEQRPEATDRPPSADAPAKPDVGDRTAAATETGDVKLALSMDKTVDASDINVDTDAGTKIVTLKGTVASAEQKARAEAVAVREAAGYRVVNQLVVKRKAD
jgi:osmotically-inducible protein OsmY